MQGLTLPDLHVKIAAIAAFKGFLYLYIRTPSTPVHQDFISSRSNFHLDPHTMPAFQLALSDESKERLAKVMDYSRTIAHYGFIPFILYLGWKASPTRPSLFNLLSPFPSA